MDTSAAAKRRPAPKTWEEYEAGVVSWLSENWGRERLCPYCNNPDWEINPVVQLVKSERWPYREVPGGFFPAIPVRCTKCGHFVLLHALQLFEPQGPAWTGGTA